MRCPLTKMVITSVAVLMAGTENLQGDDKKMPIKTAVEARRALHDQVKALGLLKGKPREWWSRLKKGEKWAVRRRSFLAAIERVEDTLLEDEKKHAILYGKLDDLRKKGDCWHVEDFGKYKSSVIAYLDAKTGKLVFLWIAREG